jgi:hypothetical protein
MQDALTKEHEVREITITPEQAALVAELQAAVDAAQGRLNLLLAGVLAGHGMTSGQVTRLDGTTLTVVS